MKNSQLPSTSVKKGLLLGLICLPIFIGALDLTVVSAILPHVIRDLEIPLQSGLDNASWIVTGYLLAYSVSMTFMGRLSDLYGRRRVYLIALVIFAFGSYLVAVADDWPTRLVLRGYYLIASGRPDLSYTTLYILIAARMIQAFGAGTMVPVGMALVGDLYPIAGRARPLGLIAAVDTAGWVVGHLYGGILVRFWDWRMIFWLNLPVCILAFIIIWYLLREVPQKKSTGSMDWMGAGLLTSALTCLNIGLGSSSDPGTNISIGSQSGLSPQATYFFLAAIFFLILFVWRQKRAQYPLIKPSLFRLPNYTSASLANFLIGFSLFIAIANVPLFINSLVANTLEQGAWDSGWMLSALTVPMALATIPGGMLSDRYGYRLPAISGLILAVLGLGLMKTWAADISYTQMVPHLMLGGVGIGLTMAPVAAAVINSSPIDQRGTSSALVIIFRLIGMTIGVSTVTTYDLIRFERVSNQLLSAAANLNETVQIGMQAMEQVISETFVLAGIVAALAFFPILLLKNHPRHSEEE